MSEHEQFLVITFVGSTHVLGMNEADELDEAALPGFATDTTTLFCGSLDNDQMVQVRPPPPVTAIAELCSCSRLTRLHASSGWQCACWVVSIRHVLLEGDLLLCSRKAVLMCLRGCR